MSTLLELKQASYTFRRLSSSLLGSDRETAEVNLTRLMKFIDENSVVAPIVISELTDVVYDFNDCFVVNGYGFDMKIPVDEREHLKAQYDFAKFIVTNESESVHKWTMQSQRGVGKDKIQQFLSETFKPMIDYIIDALASEMMILESQTNAVPSFSVTVEKNYGTMNTQGSGNITSDTTVYNESKDTLALIEKLIASLPQIEDIDTDEIDNVKDDLESVQEQLKSEAPRKNRLQKALNGIKKFASDFTMKLAVSCAAGAVTNTDWMQLIEQMEQVIERLG